MNFEAEYSWSISARVGDRDKILKGHEEDVRKMWSDVSSIHSFIKRGEEEANERAKEREVVDLQ